MLTQRNKFSALQKSETHTTNDEFENFVNAHLEATAEWLQTKHGDKPTVPWETLSDVKLLPNAIGRTQPISMPWNLKRYKMN